MKTLNLKSRIYPCFNATTHSLFKFYSILNRKYFYSVFYNNESTMIIYYKGKVLITINDIRIENLDFQIPLFGLAYFYISEMCFDSYSIDYDELIDMFVSYYSML